MIEHFCHREGERENHIREREIWGGEWEMESEGRESYPWRGEVIGYPRVRSCSSTNYHTLSFLAIFDTLTTGQIIIASNRLIIILINL